MSTNPYAKWIPGRGLGDTVRTLRRLDGQGTLYYMDCRVRYDSVPVRLAAKLIARIAGAGCSAFAVHDPEGHMLTGRNYDMPHPDRKGGLSGLNIVMRCHPRKGYRSLCAADACWISMTKRDFFAGAPDDGRTDMTPLALLPYLCMDGMNEKGLTCSILALDTADGEKPVCQRERGKRKMNITLLLREALDTCADLNEVIALAKTVNMRHTFRHDYHLFVADARGSSAVLEWRNDTLTVTPTDAATNFYLSYDDACDRYVLGKLKEKYPGPANCGRRYRYGLGHGYGRFNTIAERLDGRESMTHEEARRLLADVAQEYTGELTSFTQYSVVYDQTALRAEVIPHAEPERVFSFQMDEN